MMSEITRTAIQAPIAVAMASAMSRSQFHAVAQDLLRDFDRVTAERDALQLRLNAADQRIDDQAGLLRRCVMAVREQHCDPDEAEFDLPAELMADIDAQLSASTESGQDDDWHMNPCKQGHRDVGASGGVAACNQCNEKIEAATTQEAFERWNATHPATESAGSR
ncbi:hypothetical protein [Pseudomonas sp. MWU12-3103b]|uniref:hypothetical protein n=1 Tax=Pseudomonas sp. MWU12-3103b TaxID=2928857 RepID=UPI001FFFCFD9|nr:hypothetical protein [Pseudomonas sp. MWU12-3103b]